METREFQTIDMFMSHLFRNEDLYVEQTHSAYERVFIRSVLGFLKWKSKYVYPNHYEEFQNKIDIIRAYLIENKMLIENVYGGSPPIPIDEMHLEGIIYKNYDINLEIASDKHVMSNFLMEDWKKELQNQWERNKEKIYENKIKSWILGLWIYRYDFLGCLFKVLKYTKDFFSIQNVDNVLKSLEDPHLEKSWIFFKSALRENQEIH